MAVMRRGWNSVGVVAAVALSALFAAGCGESGVEGDALSFAPPEAFGVIHIELKPLVDSVLAELQKQKADLGDVPLDEIRKTAEKAAVMDVFLIPGAGDRPLNVCGIVRRPITPADFGALMKASGEKAPELKKLGNGRYGTDDDSGQVLIYGPEASDVPDGVLLIGEQTLLTEEYLKRFGTGKHEKVRPLMRDVRLAAPLWVAASLESLWLPIPIKVTSVSGWFDTSGGGDGCVTVGFADEANAKTAYAQVAALDKSVAENVAIEQKGNVITVKPKGGNLLARIVSDIIASRQTVKKAQ